MAYRKVKKPERIHRVLQDMTTKNRTIIQNGATAYLAIPCWYQEINHPQHTHVHDREWHDHIGWPDPNHPDRSSQAAYALRYAPYTYDKPHERWHLYGRYLDLSGMHPIHLLKEGYSGVEIAFANPPEGLHAEGYIDEKSDWVARFMINPMCPAAQDEDVNVSYTVFVTGNTGGRSRRDVVAHGTLRILAGPIA